MLAHHYALKARIGTCALGLGLGVVIACRAGTLSGTEDEGISVTAATPTAEGTAAQGATAAAATVASNANSASPVSAPATSPPSTIPTSSSSNACSNADGRKVAVSTAAQLTQALANVRPNDVIILADGTYEGAFTAAVSGTEQAPIALCGSPNAVLHGPSLTAGYTLHLQNVQHWHVVGITVTGGAKGVMLDGSGHNVLSHLVVQGIGSEGIHLRTGSSDNLVDGCTVSQTGTAGNPMFGEGIYIGSSQTNWCTLNAGQADRSDRNTVQNCTISQCTAEAIDIKEGTSSGQLLNNVLDGAGINPAAATSIINVKGNSYLVQGNQLGHAPTDAMSIHVILAGWGACNRFIDNSSASALTGYGIHLAAPMPWPPTSVTSSNLFPAAASGMTNATLSSSLPADAVCQSAITSVTCAN